MAKEVVEAWVENNETGVLVPMPTLPPTVRLLVTSSVLAMVEEDETMMPTVVVGLMALAEAKFQLEGVMSAAFCQEEFPRLSVAVST